MNDLSHMGTLVRVSIAFAILTVLCAIFFGIVQASEAIHPGVRYKIIKPLYVMGVYNSLNNRKLGQATARAYLHPTRYYEKSEVAFQDEVPAGTVITFIGSAPKVWYLPFLANRYFVQLDPDLSRGINVVLELNSGMEGDLDGLNPEVFARIK